MACVYVLRTASGTRYIGSTINLNRRMLEHEKGLVLSTKNKRPVQLVAIREFNKIKDAAVWEKKYKRSSGQLERDLRKNILRSVH